MLCWRCNCSGALPPWTSWRILPGHYPPWQGAKQRFNEHMALHGFMNHRLSEDIATLLASTQSCADGGPCLSCAESGRLRHVLESSVPWTIRAAAVPVPSVELHEGKWKVAIVGAHPSLCADIGAAVDSALDGRTEQQYYGLSCPDHHAASHHCRFRCEVSVPQSLHVSMP